MISLLGDKSTRGTQFIVGLISLIAIPIVAEVHMNTVIVRGDMAVMLSRILISFACAAGGGDYFACDSKSDR